MKTPDQNGNQDTGAVNSGNVYNYNDFIYFLPMKYVYLIKNNDGKYKIGIAKSPNKRLNQLQTGNPNKLIMVTSYQSINASKIETTLHNQYSHLKENGEWFNLSLTEEMDFIKNCEKIDNTINVLIDMGNSFI